MSEQNTQGQDQGDAKEAVKAAAVVEDRHFVPYDPAKRKDGMKDTQNSKGVRCTRCGVVIAEGKGAGVVVALHRAGHE